MQYQVRTKFFYFMRQPCLRIASNTRVFPLLNLGGEQSDYIVAIGQKLQSDGFEVGIQKVGYELQRGGNEMLWAKHP